MNKLATISSSELLAELLQIIDEDLVIDDPAELERLSSDVYSAGVTAACAVRPQDRASLPELIRTITAAGYAVYPRGGGMSYTSGYTPDRENSVIVDLGKLTKIVGINADDMTITVEAGVTWKMIYEALDPLALRLPFFGTFSGSLATVGGGMSNGALFMGTARYGTGAEIVLGLEVVTATGNVVRTGQAGFRNGKAFYRTYGPDLTGLFIHDAGALGVKTLVTLRMIEKPLATDYASFVFADSASAAAAMSAIARSGAVEEVYVFDPEATSRSLDASDLKADIKRLLNVVKSQGGIARGVRAGAELIGAGRNFVDGDVYSLHVVCANNSRQSVAKDIQACSKLAVKHGGGEIANSIPKAARANPFEPLNGILGQHGDRWAALNAKVAHSDATALIDATEALFEKYSDEMRAANVSYSRLFIAISNHAFSFEPVLRWYDEWLPLHRTTPEPEYLRKLTEPMPNPVARELVARIRKDIVSLFAELGAASNQIGRTYRYYDSLLPETAQLVSDLKRSLDPDGLMNPGVLGIPC